MAGVLRIAGMVAARHQDFHNKRRYAAAIPATQATGLRRCERHDPRKVAEVKNKAIALPGGGELSTLRYLLELTSALITQTPAGQQWPDIVRVRAPCNRQEAHLLVCWRAIVEDERGAPIVIAHDCLH